LAFFPHTYSILSRKISMEKLMYHKNMIPKYLGFSPMFFVRVFSVSLLLLKK